MDTEKRLELILEAALYCRRVESMGMPKSAYSKALREPIHFLWEKRFSANKERAAKYRSVAARGLEFGSGLLVYDHAIPFRYVIEKILDADEVTIESLRSILENDVVTCLITAEEDAKLNRAKLKQKMPEGWDGIDVLARYRAAGIAIEER